MNFKCFFRIIIGIAVLTQTFNLSFVFGLSETLEDFWNAGERFLVKLESNVNVSLNCSCCEREDLNFSMEWTFEDLFQEMYNGTLCKNHKNFCEIFKATNCTVEMLQCTNTQTIHDSPINCIKKSVIVKNGDITVQSSNVEDTKEGQVTVQSPNDTFYMQEGQVAVQSPDDTFYLKEGQVTVQSPDGFSEEIHRKRRQVGTCGYPLGMATNSMDVLKYPGSVHITQKCLFGYTFKEGITRKMRCQHTEDKWKPTGFEECKPFVDCSLSLILPGTVSCTAPNITAAPTCKVMCYPYEDKLGIPENSHTCQIYGSWKPKLPPCVKAGTAIELVQAPRIRLHPTETVEETSKTFSKTGGSIRKGGPRHFL